MQSGLTLLAGTPFLRWREMSAYGQASEAIASGPFQPDWNSLKQYRTPKWFRNAKFGIWAHWSPQCVPEEGDWYARNMYIQGSAQYDYHVGRYGHPTQFGYKDICHLWKAEKWDPEGMIQLYKRAGARYFVALANHHDGFDCWNSTYQPWNAVNIGPRRDIVGTWAEIARKHGLRFGVSAFSSTNWEWLNVSHGSDKVGPLKGVPYDGNLTETAGKGKWWQGYDPRDLYDAPHPENQPPPLPYVQKFFKRTKDLIDKYQPDLIFFNDTPLPLGATGLRLAAHYYNSSLQWHGGKLEAVINGKHVPEELRQTVVWDRWPPAEIEPLPWQIDICIGDWHYKRNIIYLTPAQVLPYFVDVISKNGNLLLNIPVKGDGTIDDREIIFLGHIADWMDINGEAIFDTRPWKVFGEGPAHVPPEPSRERKVEYTAKDIRFTTKGDALYAIALGWPDDGQLTVKSLARNAPYFFGTILSVELLGTRTTLKWARDDGGLTIALPPSKPCDYAYTIKILCANT